MRSETPQYLKLLQLLRCLLRLIAVSKHQAQTIKKDSLEIASSHHSTYIDGVIAPGVIGVRQVVFVWKVSVESVAQYE